MKPDEVLGRINRKNNEENGSDEMDFLALKSGTDIRGVASEGVNGQNVNLTDEVLIRIAHGFLIWCTEHFQKDACMLRIAIGHDSRISAKRIETCLTEAFTECGIHVLQCGLSSTPAMFMSVLELPCDCAVQITASHHPFNRNGLKFFTANGGLDAPDIASILQYAAENRAPKKAASGEKETVPFMIRYAELLRNKIMRDVADDREDTPLAGFRIVVDAGNGAGGFYATEVLKPLGADITGSVFLEPDGMFPNHAPNPENPEAMHAVSQAVLQAGADLGVIFDTDVDRGAAVDAKGKEISRNRLVALASAIALEDCPGGTIVTDSITSDGLKQFIEERMKGKHHRFKRGYKNVINEAIRLNEAHIPCPLAIETSGHAAMRENYFLDDGAYLVTKIIIKMALLKKEGRTIDDLLAGLEEAVEEQELRIPITAADFRGCGEGLLEKLAAYAKDEGWEIAPDNYEGLRVSFPSGQGDGWFLLRLSVHDPIMPLNIESNTVGGTAQILNKLTPFLMAHGAGLDLQALAAQ